MISSLGSWISHPGTENLGSLRVLISCLLISSGFSFVSDGPNNTHFDLFLGQEKYEKAITLFKAKKYGEAFLEFEKILENAVTSVDKYKVNFGLMGCCFYQEKYDEAIKFENRDGGKFLREIKGRRFDG